MIQTKGKVGVFTCIDDKISAEKNLHKKNRSLNAYRTLIYFGHRRPRVLVINVYIIMG